jgi:hypothetical protein
MKSHGHSEVFYYSFIYFGDMLSTLATQNICFISMPLEVSR